MQTIYLQPTTSGPKDGYITKGENRHGKSRIDIRLIHEKVIFARKVVEYGHCAVWLNREDKFPVYGEFFLIENSLNWEVWVRANGKFHQTHTCNVGGWGRRPYNDNTPLSKLNIFGLINYIVILWNDAQTKQFEDGSISDSWATVTNIEAKSVSELMPEAVGVSDKEFEFSDLL